MRIRNFQSEASASQRIGSQLNKVFLSQSQPNHDNDDNDDNDQNDKNDKANTDGKSISHKVFRSLRASPKAMYKSMDGFDPFALTIDVIDKCSHCCVFAKWQPFLPFIFGMCCMVCTLWVLAFLTSASSTMSLNSLKTDSTGKQLYLLEIDEIVKKLMDIRQTGKMIEFEDTLSIIIPKYCLTKIQTPLSIKAEESFHLNVAETIRFIATGGEFEKHESLKLAPNGGIVDPKILDETHGFEEKEFQACPLLDEIFRVASLNKQLKSNPNHPHMPDNIDQFDRSYNFDSVEYFVDYTIKLMQGECDQLRDRLEIQDQKSLVLNFFNTIKLRSGNPDVDVASHYQIYVIASDGSIYESEPDYDSDVYYRCVPIEVVLNTNVIIETGMSITNLRIALDKEYE